MKKFIPAYIVLICSLILAILAWKLALSVNERYLRVQFETECDQIEQRLNFWLEPNSAVLENLQGMFHNVVQIVRDIFELYVSIPESSHPGVQAIGYAPRVRQSELPEFLSYVQNEGYLQYHLTPPGRRPVYFPAQYVVPIARNRNTSGYDLYSHYDIRRAIETAIDSNRTCSTRLVSATNDKDSTVFFVLPIFGSNNPGSTPGERRANVKGVCFIELHVRTFIERSLHFNYDSSRISFTVYDGADTTAPVIFGMPVHAYPGQRYVKYMHVFDRTWTLVFTQRLGPAAIRQELVFPDVILYSGFGIGLVLFLIIFIFIVKLDKIKNQLFRQPR